MILEKLFRRETRSQAAGPAKYSRYLAELEQCAGGLAGKKLLEIGSDKSGHLLREALLKGAARAAGVNPSLPGDSTHDRVELRAVSAVALPFPDEDFDVIASLSVFEHIHELEAVLSECFRVLRPGGVLYTEFGPIWSSAWGHHLWLWHDGSVVDWRTHRLPPYAHLLMDPAELRSWCVATYRDEALCDKIVKFVYESDEQNRLFYSDYEQLLDAGPFRRVFACGLADVPHPAGTPPSDYPATFRRLADRYPGKTGFGYHCIRAMLVKPDVTSAP